MSSATDGSDPARARLTGYFDAVIRRWRLLDGLTRLLWATTVLSAVALFGALGRFTGLVSTRVALAPLAIATPILLLWSLHIVLRSRSRAAAATIVDQSLDERDRFKTACELLDRPGRTSPESPVDWTPYVLGLAARRSEDEAAAPSRILPLPESGLFRAAGGALVAAALAWAGLGYFGAPDLRLPVHLVELPGARDGEEDASAAVAPGEGVRAAEAPVPLTEEQLRKLLERAHRDSGLRDDGNGEPFDGELSEVGEDGAEQAGEGAEGEAEAPDTELLEEVRRDLKEALDAQRGEDMAEGDEQQPGQEGAEGEQGAADGEADPDAQQVQDDSMAPGEQEQAQMQSSGQSSEQGDTTTMSEAEMAAAAAPSEGAEGEREGQSMGEGTGPQEGEAELYGDMPFQPLSAAVELQSALIEDQAQDFTTREREEKELPSRAQKAKRQYRRVTIPSRSDNETFVDTRPVPWQYRELVQRVFTPEEETEGDNHRY